MEPSVVLALIAFFASLAAVAFAANSVSKLSDQYTAFVKTHIHDLRADFNREGKRIAKLMDEMIRQVDASARSGSKTDTELDELKNQLFRLQGKLKVIEDSSTRSDRRMRH